MDDAAQGKAQTARLARAIRRRAKRDMLIACPTCGIKESYDSDECVVGLGHASNGFLGTELHTPVPVFATSWGVTVSTSTG